MEEICGIKGIYEEKNPLILNKYLSVMKLTGFRIKNYKSIIDTKWCNISTDNITGLIGQNESGKSSILEALYSFYTESIVEDAIRHDETWPEISCAFYFSRKEFAELFEGKKLPKGLLEIMALNNGILNLSVKWESTSDYVYSVEQENISNLFGTHIKTSIEVALDMEPTLTESEFLDIISRSMPSFQMYDGNKSLLPNTIDLDDLLNKNTKAEGYIGVQNFLTIAEIDLDELRKKTSGIQRKLIREVNASITANFQEFWRQKIGKSNQIEISFELKNYNETHAQRGKFYLEFWINDGFDELHPKQRSQGVRWFLSFYLQLKASKIENETANTILLIDEPGESLHARAQEDVLKVFEDISSNIQIVYTTHSPYLIKLEWIHRLLAVQRADDNDENSETQVFSALQLGSASSDTLTPLLTNMGVDVSHQGVIEKGNNVILEEPSGYYYFIAFVKLLNHKGRVNFLPATGVTKIPLLVNLFLGWGLDFITVFDNDKAGQRVYNELKKDIFGGDEEYAKTKLLLLADGCLGIEDIFSKRDFQKYVLENEEQNYDVKNSEHLKDIKISKPLLAIKFRNKIEQGETSFDEFDDETRGNITNVVNAIEDLLRPKKSLVSQNLVTQVEDQLEKQTAKE